MATSQNGWTAITSGSDKNLENFPWITGKVRKGATATVLKYVAEQFNKRVEPIRKDWSWGWNYRVIRGASSNSLSNHASGTAVDFNAPNHGIGRRNTFTRAQQAEIRKILKEVSGAIRWGGDYAGRPDDMHFEVNCSAAKLALVAAKVTGKNVVQAVTGNKPPKAPATTPPATPHTVTPKVIQERLKAAGYAVKVTGRDDAATRAVVRNYQTSQVVNKLVGDGQWGKKTEEHFAWTVKLQEALNKWKGTKLVVDGDFRKRTADRVKEWQSRNKGGAYKGIVDGQPGSVTTKALGIPEHP